MKLWTRNGRADVTAECPERENLFLILRITAPRYAISMVSLHAYSTVYAGQETLPNSILLMKSIGNYRFSVQFMITLRTLKHLVVPMHVFPFGANWSPLEGHKHRTSSFTSSQPYWQFTMAHVLES